jgi:hypothetical protein
MELLDGLDLGRHVKRQGPLSVEEVTTTARQIAEGLVYLHASGFVHRDLKPSNLMRMPDATIKVLDLGLARRLNVTPAEDGLTTTGMGMGTPDYVAPEQVADAANVDVRADLYSLGATLFHLLTGQAPFADRKSREDKLQAHQSEPPPEVRSLRPEVPVPLARLVSRLLAKDPRDRLLSAAAVLKELPSPRARRRRMWILGGVAVPALAALVVLFLRDWLPSPTPGPETKSGAPMRPADNRLEVLKLEVLHFTTEGRFDRRRGILGRDSFDTRVNDSVTLDARLSRPAYAYVIAFRPDGTDQICYPEKDDVAPKRTDRPRYPSESRDVNYELDEGEGLQVFAVIACSKPLPPYREWRAGRTKSPWKHFAAPPGMVWQDNGVMVEARGPGGRMDDDSARGQGKQVPGKSELVRLTDWLRQVPGVEAVMAVGFNVGPKPPGKEAVKPTPRWQILLERHGIESEENPPIQSIAARTSIPGVAAWTILLLTVMSLSADEPTPNPPADGRDLPWEGREGQDVNQSLNPVNTTRPVEEISVKPQWQRYLRGDDGRRAKEMQEQALKLQAEGKFEEALKLAEALAALRAQKQGTDHWEAENARHYLETLRRVLRATAALRAEYASMRTHGVVDNRLPLRSALVLSRDALPDPGKQLDAGLPVYDGRLTAEKVLRQWHLNAELVTLSACETALGKYERGEGFVGFAQALSLSGSRSVCLSLWRVDDTATALLMERFYQNVLGKRTGLNGSLGKAAALREAKEWLRTLPRDQALARAAALTKGVVRGTNRPVQPLLPPVPSPPAEAREAPPYAHPYYWAAFVLIGDRE